MSLTPEEINKIAKILSVGKSYLNAQISSLGTDLTAQDETDIRAELTRWTTAGAKFTKIQPNPQNKGAEVNPELVKNDIRQNLRVLLDLETVGYYGIGTLEIGL